MWNEKWSGYIFTWQPCHGGNGLEEGGTKVRKTTRKNFEIFQGYWKFQTKAEKVGMEKTIILKDILKGMLIFVFMHYKCTIVYVLYVL